MSDIHGDDELIYEYYAETQADRRLALKLAVENAPKDAAVTEVLDTADQLLEWLQLKAKR